MEWLNVSLLSVRRAKCEGRALALGRKLLVQEGHFESIQAVVEEAKSVRLHTL